MTRLYRLKPTEWLIESINEIEDQLVPGIFSVSYSGGGFVQNISPESATKILEGMYAELETRPGYARIQDKSRHGRVIYVRMKD